MPKLLLSCLTSAPRWLSAALTVVIGFALATAAQSTESDLSRATIEARLQALESDSTLSDEQKVELGEGYRSVLANLQLVTEFNGSAEGFQKLREAPDEEIRKLREQTENPPPATMPADIAEIQAADIESRLGIARTELRSAESRVNDLASEAERQSGRTRFIRDRTVAVRSELRDVEDQIAKLSAENGDAAADLVYLRAASRRDALRAELQSLELELLTLPTSNTLMTLELQAARQETARLGETVAMLTDELQARRSEEEATAAAASEEFREQHPALGRLAEANRALLSQISEIETEIRDTQKLRQEIGQLSDALTEDARRAERRLDAAGLTEALGQLLIAQRNTLPNLSVFERDLTVREHAYANAAVAQIVIEDEQRELLDEQRYTTNRYAELDDADEDARGAFAELLLQRRELLSSAINRYDALLLETARAIARETELIENTKAFADFLTGNLLWVRTPFGGDIGNTLKRAQPLLTPRNWLEFAANTGYGILTTPALALTALVLLGLIALRPRLRRALENINKRIRTPATDQFHDTFLALLLNTITASPLPLAILLLGLDHRGVPASLFEQSVREACVWLATPLFLLSAVRETMKPGGFARIHFRWSAALVADLYREVNWISRTILPLAFAAVFTIVHEPDAIGGGALGAGFIIAIASVALIGATRFFRGSWASGRQVRPTWVLLVLSAPAAVLLLQIAGFHYAAQQAIGLMFNTTWMLTGVVFVHQLLTRWLMILRARIEASPTVALDGMDEQTATAGESSEVVDQIDVEELSIDNRHLLNLFSAATVATGLWLIWSPVFPGVSLLDTVELWRQNVPQGDGSFIQQAVTLGSILKALFLLILTILAAQQLPSVVEVVLLERMAMSPGARYAASKMLQYVVVGGGVIAVAGMLGARWSQIQWLIAALGVGIGFGLQEIFANFISGIVILFERPIRVGDVVSVGGSDGTVTRIKIRATTIRTFDRKELLVPNKEFITGQLLNWSLTDAVTRVMINVGVEYGSDTEHAMRLMVAASEQVATVFAEPPPSVTFDGFGDNSLSLTLRCFTDTDSRLETISALHSEIDKKFRDANIVIAFPQRDLHVDIKHPLMVEMDRSRRRSEPPQAAG